MSGGLSDLVANLEIDTSEFVAPIAKAADSLSTFADSAMSAMKTAEKSIEPVTARMVQQTAEIEQQGRGWREFGGKAGGSMASLGDSAARAALPVGRVLGLLSSKLGLKQFALVLTSIGNAYRWMAGSADESAKKVAQANERQGISAKVAASATAQMKAANSAHASSAEGIFAAVGKKSVLAYLAYKVAIEEVIQASGKHLRSDSALMKATSGLMGSIGELTGSIVGQFTEGLKGSFVAVLNWATGFESITDAVDAGAKTLTSWANTAKAAIDEVTKTAYDAGGVISTWLAFGSHTSDDAVAFAAEGQALRKLAADTEKVIAVQERQRDMLRVIRDTQDEAEANAIQAEALRQISTLKSVAAIEEEIQAIKQRGLLLKNPIADKKGKLTGVGKDIAGQIAALEKRRGEIEAGTDKDSYATEQIKQAEMAILKLTQGEVEHALSLARLKPHTDQEIEDLRRALEAQKEVEGVMKSRHAFEAAAERDAQKQAQANQQAVERLQTMRDKIDELNGTATKTQILGRELSRLGVDPDKIAEIEAANEQMEALQKKKEQHAKNPENKAAFMGSAEAASIVLRGVGKPQGQDKQIALAASSNAALGKIAASIDKGLTIEIEEVSL